LVGACDGATEATDAGWDGAKEGGPEETIGFRAAEDAEECGIGKARMSCPSKV
jgi:hypothetical protein